MREAEIIGLEDRIEAQLRTAQLVAYKSEDEGCGACYHLAPSSYEELVKAYRRAGCPTPEAAACETTSKIIDCLLHYEEPQEEFGLPGYRRLVYFDLTIKEAEK